MAVLEFLRLQLVTELKHLREDRVAAVGPGPHVQEQGGRAGDIVDEVAAHAQGHVEKRRGRLFGGVRADRVRGLAWMATGIASKSAHGKGRSL